MANNDEEAAFNDALCARLRGIRETMPGGKWSAERMATVLGIPPDRYRKYEIRSPLPHYLIPKIAVLAGLDISYILTGKSDRRLQPIEHARKNAG